MRETENRLTSICHSVIANEYTSTFVSYCCCNNRSGYENIPREKFFSLFNFSHVKRQFTLNLTAMNGNEPRSLPESLISLSFVHR